MKSKHLILLSCMIAQLAGAASGQSILIDFGRHDDVNGHVVTNPAIATGGSNALYWNSVGETGQAQTADTVYGSLVDVDNNPLTGWTITTGANVQANGTANGGLLAPSFALLGDLAVPAATEDYWFTTTTGDLVLGGLNPSWTYSFTFFGTRETTGARSTRYDVTGLAGTVSSSLLATSGTAIGTGGYNGNNDTTVSVLDIAPTAGGEISIGFVAASGGFGYLGVMEVTAVPEPATYALLLGIAALGLVRYRRRRMAE